MRRSVVAVLSTVPLICAALMGLGVAPASAATSSCNSHIDMYGPVGSETGFVLVPAYKSSPNCIIKASSTSHAWVEDLQAALNLCNGASLTVDGVYGAKTTAAVKAVQKKAGLTQDGVYGPDTFTATKWHVLWTSGGHHGTACDYGSTLTY